MKNKIIDIRNYHPSDKERYLLDANIWLSICCPIGNYEKQRAAIYSSFLKEVMKVNAKIVLCSMVLSEVVNKWFSIEFKILQNTQPEKYIEYKRDFRGKEIYKIVAKEIETGIYNQILKIASPIDDGFSKANIRVALSNIAEIDFNDLCHSELANRENLVLVTNDGDFISIGNNIKVLTANNKIIGLAREADARQN